MTKGNLKEILAQLEILGVNDNVEIVVRRAVDNSLINLQNQNFDVQGQDATYSIDASDHWAPTVSEPALVILKQV